MVFYSAPHLSDAELGSLELCLTRSQDELKRERTRRLQSSMPSIDTVFAEGSSAPASPGSARGSRRTSVPLSEGRPSAHSRIFGPKKDADGSGEEATRDVPVFERSATSTDNLGGGPRRRSTRRAKRDRMTMHL